MNAENDISSQSAHTESPASGGSVATSELIQRLIGETDWEKFWADVAEKAAPEIEAYRRAEAMSRNQIHVFV